MASLSGVGQTARLVAAVRAVETESSTPLFIDPYARYLAGEDGFTSFETVTTRLTTIGASGFVARLAIRTRYFDETLMTAISQGIKQLVILAAGFDARAFRLEFPKDLTLWELDRQEIFDLKESILREIGAIPTCQRHLVPVDLRDEWPDVLCQAGFDPTKPTAFLVEGLLVYLEEPHVHTLLGRIGAIASSGSWLGTDVVGTELMEHEPMRPQIEWLAEMGSPWIFSTLDPEGLLSAHGWDARCSVPGDPDAHFGRVTNPVMSRSISGVPRSYYISAIR